MEAVMQVALLQNGHYAVKSIGGVTLNRILAQFETRAEAEEWMMRHTSLSRAGSGIMHPGDGQAVA